MTSTDDPQAPNTIEREALRLAIATVRDPAARDALRRQADALRVLRRDYTGAGFYTYFTCPVDLRGTNLPEDDPPRFWLLYPSDTGALSFIVYLKDGAIDYLEGASSGTWPEESAVAGLWPDRPEPITFDPALLR